MCNPRRVRVALTESVNERWRREIEETARLESVVNEQLRLSINIPMSAQLGTLPLQMVERILRGDTGMTPWQQGEDGNLRRQVGDVTLVYTLGSAEFIVEANLSDMVSAEARATMEAEGVTIGEVAVEAVGTYYDDGWGGRNEAHGREIARANAERQVQERIEALHRAQNPEVYAELQAQAEAQAEEELARLREEARAALRNQLQARMDSAQEQVRMTVNNIVGEAYRQSIMQVVAQNGGRVLNNSQNGSVMRLEVEI